MIGETESENRVVMSQQKVAGAVIRVGLRVGNHMIENDREMGGIL